MPSRIAIVVMTLLCSLALNAAGLLLDLSSAPPTAATRMSYQNLLRDPDFGRAVKTIAKQCSVNVKLA